MVSAKAKLVEKKSAANSVFIDIKMKCEAGDDMKYFLIAGETVLRLVLWK